MNTDTLMYAVKVAILGLGVVFLSLWALSILMSLIKRIFDREETKSGTGGKGVKTGSAGDRGVASTGSTASPTDEGIPPWVISGVVAYLTEEELEVSRSAEPWKSSNQARIDPWLMQGFRRRG